MNAHIRPATADDTAAMMALILELAEYENGLHLVINTAEQLRRDGFELDPPRFEALVAEQHGEVVGMALCCFHYSTWRGHRLYLEDLIVRQSARGGGIGAELLQAVKQLAITRDCTGVNWQVLDWNEPAIRFYKKLGVDFDAEWVNCYWPRERW